MRRRDRRRAGLRDPLADCMLIARWCERHRQCFLHQIVMEACFPCFCFIEECLEATCPMGQLAPGNLTMAITRWYECPYQLVIALRSTTPRTAFLRKDRASGIPRWPKGATGLLHACYSLVTCLLHYCYMLVIALLRACYSLVTCVLQPCYMLVTSLLHACYSACYSLARMQGRTKPVTSLAWACYSLA